MFTDILATIFTSYKLSLSPKDFTVIKMDKDDEEKMQKIWHAYLDEEYSYEDFFYHTPEDLMEKQEAYNNPVCVQCSMTTYTLLTSGQKKTLSKCPKCKQTFINNN